MTAPIIPTPPKDKPYTMSRIARHAFTGPDNSTVDVARVLWAMGALSFILLSAYFVWKTGQWNPLEWGSGFAAVNGGSSAAIKFKEKSEPPVEEKG